MNTVQELANKEIESGKILDINPDEIQNTVEYSETLNKIKSQWKELRGTEKQIAWAIKIREEKSANLAYNFTLHKYYTLAGRKLVSDKQVERMKTEYAFLASENSSTIINNR